MFSTSRPRGPGGRNTRRPWSKSCKILLKPENSCGIIALQNFKNRVPMKLTRKMQLERELEKILRILKHDFHPERVILFGSLNGRRVSEESDIDLLIIKKS